MRPFAKREPSICVGFRPSTRFRTRAVSLGWMNSTVSKVAISKLSNSMMLPSLAVMSVTFPSVVKLTSPATAFSPSGAARTSGAPGGATSMPTRATCAVKRHRRASSERALPPRLRRRVRLLFT
jgi:hypothetical protein